VRDQGLLWLIGQILASGVGVLSEEYDVVYFPGRSQTFEVSETSKVYRRRRAHSNRPAPAGFTPGLGGPPTVIDPAGFHNPQGLAEVA
jgi:hypothetical protein